MKKKNVAIITWRLSEGGAERIAGLLSKQLEEIYNVYLFIVDVSNIVYDYGGKLVHVGVGGLQYVEYYIDRYKQELSIDCAISFLHECNFYNLRTRHREKVIVSKRCALSPQYPINLCSERCVKEWYPSADAVVAVSEGVRFDLVNNYGLLPEKVYTIYNFIDKQKIHRQAMVPPVLPNTFPQDAEIIVNIGRLTYQKNQKRLIRQFAGLAKKRPRARLLILGSGELQNEVYNFYKLLPLWQNPRKIVHFFAVFVLCTIYLLFVEFYLSNLYRTVINRQHSHLPSKLFHQ